MAYWSLCTSVGTEIVIQLIVKLLPVICTVIGSLVFALNLKPYFKTSPSTSSGVLFLPVFCTVIQLIIKFHKFH